MKVNNKYKLQDKLPEEPICFFGRDNLLKKIQTIFSNDNKVIFLQGIGGIGKTTLAKQYVKQYQKNYDQVLFLYCTSDLKSLITDDDALPITGIKRNVLENDTLEDVDDYFERKLKALKETTSSKTLIIIDNFNRREDVFLNEFLTGNYKVLFTSRNDWSNWKYPVICVQEIEDMDALKQIFHFYYKKNILPEDQKYIEEIIHYVQNHTLLVEWLGKQMAEGIISPMIMCQMLREKGLCFNEGSQNFKDENLDKIYNIFNFNKLTNEEKNVLMYMIFTPYTGISKQDLILRCERGCHSALLKLMRNSWIQVNNENGDISLHPVLAELAFQKLKPDWKKIYYFANRIKEDMENIEFSNKIVEAIVPISINLLEKLPLDCSLAIEFALSISYALDFRKIDWNLAEKYAKEAIEAQRNLKTQIRKKLSGFQEENIFDIEYNLLKSEIYNADVRVSNGINRLGCIYFDRGEYQRALEEFLKLKEYSNIMDPYGNLASTYQSLGNLDLALEYAEKSLDYRKKKYGKDSYHLYSNYKQIGLIFRDLEDNEKAISYLDLAGEILEKELDDNENHIFYAEFLMQYASVLRQMQKSKGALRFDLKALEITRNVLGNDNLEIAKCYAAMAIDYYRSKDFIHTLECTLNEIDIRKRHKRIKMRLYMSISRLLPLIGEDLQKYPQLLQRTKDATSEFNELIKEYPKEGLELMQQ